METQNVRADAKGNYTVQLGASQANGLPLELFASGDARWLGVRINGGDENPRVLLLSVPYALKAADAETLGGKPASAFLTAQRAGASLPQAATTNTIVCASGTACKTGFVPVFSSPGGSASVVDSLISQSGSTIGITGNQKVTASISAGGNVSAAGNINTNGNVSASSMTATSFSTGINSTITGTGSPISAVTGTATATGPAGFTFGVTGQSASDNGRGVFGLSTGANGVGVIGETNSGGIGLVGKALPGSTGIGVWGSSASSWSFYSDGDASQNRSSGGWVKAMLYVNTYQAPYNIVRCYNSALQGAAASTPPCGFNLIENFPGDFLIDMGFEVDDRFVTATAYGDFALPWILFQDSHTYNILWYRALNGQIAAGENYWLVVY
jgi:hypothetical protein